MDVCLLLLLGGAIVDLHVIVVYFAFKWINRYFKDSTAVAGVEQKCFAPVETRWPEQKPPEAVQAPRQDSMAMPSFRLPPMKVETSFESGKLGK